ncbi:MULTISPECIES: hypothetical protein [unclassified Pseudomonas]|uniref:hypothetical protein n=1 Tax=unclassified Pseudomonas TaxID=196821 RepID=UPI000C86CB76|nr:MULTISPECIES: hypothetical protein [unclassified Pseudomonas]PMU23002.1 hypothetical protein C1X90_18220 [Pseudomonas sp. GP01-A9]PMU28584.1 hypothetical protein C1X88_17870 [Pseudomonas sp. GP01-A13]PMU38836.1 hypothetical protein C1X89_15425 [Pseudomonas sp. GP01-A8]PMU52454.1 hypothetical protein C1X85_18980 [Pseudomonas sp. GP01-A6]PMU54451.1 hypothetical protein C1X87_06485 [Pseudomonas sp. GP01-A14]
MMNRPVDIKDPITAHLAMHIDMINDAEHDLTVRLNAWQAHGYLKALYDIDRIQAATYSRYCLEIEQLREARLDALAKSGTV